MQDCDIYRILKKYPRNSEIITSDELLKNGFVAETGFDGLNGTLSDIARMGYISAKRSGDVIYSKLTPEGKRFLVDYRYHRQLRTIETIVTFSLGVLSGVLVSYAIPLLFSLIR